MKHTHSWSASALLLGVSICIISGWIFSGCGHTPIAPGIPGNIPFDLLIPGNTQPAPALLQQLGLTPDKVESFYQPKKPPVVPEGKKPPPPCADCGGVGYKGQTAMFELLIVNDALRQALRGQADVKAVRQLGRKVGMKTLQEEGIQLVVSGETSIQELMRVLKKEETKTEG